MRVWITKYALTSGIEEIQVTVSQANVCDYMNYDYHRDEWHTTKEAAIAKAEKMRRNKLRSLRNQIDKLEQLKFT